MHLSEQPGLQVRMKAFVSIYEGVDDEWRNAWAVIEIEPSRWHCTMPVHELVRVVHSRSTDVDLRVPHEWHGDQLTLELGPAALTGTAEDWLALCRRLTETAERSEVANVLPSTPPWPGASFPIPVEDVVVEGGSPPPLDSPIERLALAGGFEPRQFVDLFGSGWVEWEDSAAGAAPRRDDLFLWGHPAQLGAIADVAERRVLIGVPRGAWSGQGHLSYSLHDPTPVSGDLPDEEIRTVVRSLLARRRRTFTWCRYCGDRLAPEHRFEPNVCYGCATEWFGVVY